MEGITRWPGSRAAEYERTHEGVAICQVEGVWRATVSLASGIGELHGDTEDEIVGKLAAALGG